MFNFNNNCRCNRPQRPCNCQWQNPCFKPCNCRRVNNNCNCNNNFRNFDEYDDNFTNFNDFDDNYQDFNNNFNNNNYYPQDFGFENDLNGFQDNRIDRHCCPRPCPNCRHRPPQNNCNRNCLCLLAGCLLGKYCNR